MVNIALIGYGKMGKAIERIAVAEGHTIVAKIDPSLGTSISAESLADADVCIEFSHPSVAIDNISKIAALGKPLVVGTTGWYEKMSEVEAIVTENNIGLLWSGNFSIGVHSFFSLLKKAGVLFNKLENYDIAMVEYHHRQKADSPSGTAQMAANILVDAIDRKTKVNVEKIEGKIDPSELHVASVRVGSVPGTHTVSFDSAEDTIEIKHTARSRDGFARGAVIAAAYIVDKKGLFTIDDLMEDKT